MKLSAGAKSQRVSYRLMETIGQVEKQVIPCRPTEWQEIDELALTESEDATSWFIGTIMSIYNLLTSP